MLSARTMGAIRGYLEARQELEAAEVLYEKYRSTPLIIRYTASHDAYDKALARLVRTLPEGMDVQEALFEYLQLVSEAVNDHYP